MPIYEYFCPNCQCKFELLRPLSQAGEAAPCPHCQQSASRVLSGFVCYSTDDSGRLAEVGGKPCSSCSAADCSSCTI